MPVTSRSRILEDLALAGCGVRARVGPTFIVATKSEWGKSEETVCVSGVGATSLSFFFSLLPGARALCFFNPRRCARPPPTKGEAHSAHHANKNNNKNKNSGHYTNNTARQQRAHQRAHTHTHTHKGRQRRGTSLSLTTLSFKCHKNRPRRRSNRSSDPHCHGTPRARMMPPSQRKSG